MSEKKFNNEFILVIEKLAFGGKGIAYNEGKIVFVDGALPFQKVLVRVIKNKKNYVEAKLIEIIEKSPLEEENEFQSTPGAPWLKLSIKKQQEIKKDLVFDLLKKNSKLNNIDEIYDEFIFSNLIFGYRNKMEYSFGYSEIENKIGLIPAFGFKKRGHFYLVENLNIPSGLFDIDFEKFLKNIKEKCFIFDLPPYNPFLKNGFYKSLLVRKSFFENKFVLVLVTKKNVNKNFNPQEFYNFLEQKLNERLKGFMWVIDDNNSDGFNKNAIIEFKIGNTELIEQMGKLKFKISPYSFFQTNPSCALKLYEKVTEYVGETNGKILDLYCGTGTISQFVASKLKNANVLGVDIDKSCINDAQENSKLNNIKNVEFHCIDTKNIFKMPFLELMKNPEVLIMDPPRSGIPPKILLKIIELKPIKIIYVSCNPATMSRDFEILINNNYKIKKFSICDQFPHTSHIECVSLLEYSFVL